jgi:hypothetical protein
MQENTFSEKFSSGQEHSDMRFLRLSLPFASLCILFLFTACTSTKFSTIWKDETYREHPKKILVINSFPNPATRRTFEDEFVEALKERGVDAVMSYTIMPDTVVSDKDAIAALAKQVTADAVLVNRPLGAKVETTELYSTGYSTGFAYKDVYIDTQTDVYDMKSNKLISIATSETQIPEGKPSQNQIQTFVKDLVNQLSRIGLF